MMKRTVLRLLGALFVLGAAVLALAWPYDDALPPSAPGAIAPTAANIARGAYLARAGNCQGCHTARAGADYAGGRPLATPFGTLYAPNITPDRATGIGDWTPDQFWRALHNGKSRDGHLLYPGFPYTNYTLVSRADADALYTFLHSLPARRQANSAHRLRFPYDQQIVLAGWRLLFFRPASFAPAPARDAAWNRGAYLVQGLGHCNACHSARNSLGASGASLQGGLMPVQGWYAPPLASQGAAAWDREQLVQLLHSGVNERSGVYGPMAETVQSGLQYLEPADLHAMASYLTSLPAEAAAPTEIDNLERPDVQAMLAQGASLYRNHCASCHGEQGQGKAPAYPPLAGSRSINAGAAVNPIRLVLHGGFAPATGANPRPYGMPPFAHVLDDADVAALLSFVRVNWGNRAPLVESGEVNRYRDVPLD